MRVLFWNTHRNANINSILSELITENRIDIVVLAEYKADIDELIDMLLESDVEMQRYRTPGCERIKIIGNIKQVDLGQQSDDASMLIINNDCILCGVHLSSQIYTSNEGDRSITIGQLVEDIQDLEKSISNENTIIVGDFNLNPFDAEITNANSLHSLPCYHVAKKKTRVVAKKEFQMFYNPMWNFFGDFSMPYGTYYYAGNNNSNIFWHLYDQVIIRPSLRERFIDKELKIITETENRFLLDSKGHPDKRISDHLPVAFEIKEN